LRFGVSTVQADLRAQSITPSLVARMRKEDNVYERVEEASITISAGPYTQNGATKTFKDEDNFPFIDQNKKNFEKVVALTMPPLPNLWPLCKFGSAAPQCVKCGEGRSPQSVPIYEIRLLDVRIVAGHIPLIIKAADILSA
jgi:hypothetical protein